MPTINILNTEERKQFDSPPKFNSFERKRFLRVNPQVQVVIDNLRTPTNRVAFLLILGYFKASGKLFNQFYTTDIEYGVTQLNLNLADIEMTSYSKQKFAFHKKMVLDFTGFQSFTPKTEQEVRDKIRFALRSQTRHRQILGNLADGLRKDGIEIPSYNTLAEAINSESNRYDLEIEQKLVACLTKADIIELESLLTRAQEMAAEQNQLLDSNQPLTPQGPQVVNNSRLATSPNNTNNSSFTDTFRDTTPYLLTELKKPYQSSQPSKIKKNLESLELLSKLFKKLEPAKAVVNFTDEGIKYYASLTIKQRLFQIIRKSPQARLIYFYCFVYNQYFKLNDTLADTIVLSANSFTHQVKNAIDQHYLESKTQKDYLFDNITKSRKTQILNFTKVKAILKDSTLADTQKVAQLETLIDQIDEADKVIPAEQSIEEVLKELGDMKAKDEYYFMEKLSKSLILKVGNIVKRLEFSTNQQTSNLELLQAIDHYRKTNGDIGVKPPTAFLKSSIAKKLKSGAKFKTSLYKVLLILQIAGNIKAGRLNLKYSYRYRSGEEYLLTELDFSQNQETYIQLANLQNIEDFNKVDKLLQQKSQTAFDQTNQGINNNLNPTIKFKENGEFTIKTPKIEESRTKLSDLLPKEQYISLIEIMHTVAKNTSFCDLFDNIQNTNNTNTFKPDKQVLLACIFALGCNLGLHKVSQITGIKESQLDYALKWYMSVENLNLANEKVVEVITKLDLPNIYRNLQLNPNDKTREDTNSRNSTVESGLNNNIANCNVNQDPYQNNQSPYQNKLFTSSDGQKVINNTDSFNSNYSYKFGGGTKASSNYTHIDMRHVIFHSTVISSSEREAIYVVDGLLHSKWVKSEIHATDTFGATEAVFGLCYLLGFDLVPRIKDLDSQQLYAFESKKYYETKKYKLLPKKKIKIGLIQTQWQHLLRLACSIKLGICSGSQILKRLNSYSRKNELYLALRELGRIIKTVTILTYIGDTKLQQMVEKQLNIVENSNRFSKVIRFGNGGEMYKIDKEDQDIAESCKRLQVNSVILHNYWYLTRKLQLENDLTKKAEMIQIIASGSPMSWSHINFYGQYSFEEEDNKDSFKLNISQIESFKLTELWEELKVLNSLKN